MSELYEWYAKEVKVTQNTDEIAYLAIKLVIEISEAAQILVKEKFHGKEFDGEKFIEEIGDALWYLFACADYMDMEVEECETGEFAQQDVDMLSEMEEAILDAASFMGRMKRPPYNSKHAGDLLLSCLFHIELALLPVCAIEEAMRYNIAKLRRRHGEAYNPAFYRGQGK